MTALLGLLALAGYQNRDKLAEMVRNAGAGQSKASTGDALSGMLGNLGGLLGGAGVGGLLNGGLGELLERFKQNGQGEAAEILDHSGTKQRPLPAGAKTGHRDRRFGAARTANWAVTGRTSSQAFARASNCGRQIHTGWPLARRVSVNAMANGIQSETYFKLSRSGRDCSCCSQRIPTRVHRFYLLAGP